MSDSCDPMDCSLPGTSIYGISQARKLEGVAIYSSRGSSRPRIKPRSPELQAISCIAGRFFTEDTHTHTKWQENVHLASQISRSSTGNSTSKRSSHPSQQWVNNFKVWGSLGDSVVKNPPAYQCKRCKRSGFDLWVRKILRRRKWQPTPIFLSRKFQEQRSLVGYSPLGSQRVRHDRETEHKREHVNFKVDIFWKLLLKSVSHQSFTPGTLEKGICFPSSPAKLQFSGS